MLFFHWFRFIFFLHPNLFNFFLNLNFKFFLTPFLFFSCVTTDFDIEANDLIDDVNVTANEASEQTADYRVSFVFDWNKTDFPTDYPSSAHFSPLFWVGA